MQSSYTLGIEQADQIIAIIGMCFEERFLRKIIMHLQQCFRHVTKVCMGQVISYKRVYYPHFIFQVLMQFCGKYFSKFSLGVANGPVL